MRLNSAHALRCLLIGLPLLVTVNATAQAASTRCRDGCGDCRQLAQGQGRRRLFPRAPSRSCRNGSASAYCSNARSLRTALSGVVSTGRPVASAT